MKKQILKIADDLSNGAITVEQAKDLLLRLFDVSKRKFAVEWVRNFNYGVGSGTEYFMAENKGDALKQFWNGKNKEAFEIRGVYAY